MQFHNVIQYGWQGAVHILAQHETLAAEKKKTNLELNFMCQNSLFQLPLKAGTNEICQTLEVRKVWYFLSILDIETP